MEAEWRPDVTYVTLSGAKKACDGLFSIAASHVLQDNGMHDGEEPSIGP